MSRKSLILILITIGGFSSQKLMAQKSSQQIEKNGMLVKWYHRNSRVHFEMSAPTLGWVTVGFNGQEGMQGAYLLMGRVRNKQAEVAEHFSLSPGNYRTIADLGEQPLVNEVKGKEENQTTTIRFSIPSSASDAYRKDLSSGNELTMILAFGREDDFQHHSVMRTSELVTL